jgi:excisionase family DNA binding protein
MNTEFMDENNQAGGEAKMGGPASYISVDEMAKLLSIARATAYQLTKTSGFPCFQIGKRIIIPLQALNAWAEEQALRQAVLFGK